MAMNRAIWGARRGLLAPRRSSPAAVYRRAAAANYSTSSPSPPSSSSPASQRVPSKTSAPAFAFAFDIDGVLLHVAEPIPGAKESLRFLHDNNIPFILLTNGGGKREADRVGFLAERLGVPLSTDNFVQSHTPFRQLVDGGEDGGLRDKTILVTGSDYERCRAIAREYGFRNVVTPADLLAAEPTLFPFRSLAELQQGATPLPKPLYDGSKSSLELESSLKIDAMFVFDDPRDWAVDIQIIMDLLLSHRGYLGTLSPKNGDASLPGCGWQQDGQPPLYFSNGDLVWAAKYHLPRFGQGAFQAAVAGVWDRYTGGHPLRRTVIGKPAGETYRFAERVLTSHRHETLRRMGLHEPPALRSVYMVGDNPESDIAGANGHVSEAGTQWVSVLVKTGVWNEERDRGVLVGRKKPGVIVDDVREAVKWALWRERWEGLWKGE
ncbi:HAD-like domain-containing protein [Echria macrotheca]|uniref:HAD-like domain-containing protein n=1 Tax=Echria macrotheca TaxID=438768 RepID=A0AAJ0F825_9PEZI|nr:HAD-like domain-containing protein [Echria macrotheca]